MWRKSILAIALMVACTILLIAAVPASDAVETGGGLKMSQPPKKLHIQYN